jgi:transposase-like protein
MDAQDAFRDEDGLPFRDEEAAYRYVERHAWPNGPVCPRCGASRRVGKLTGASTRLGTYKCYECRKPFTVKLGTLFEASHVPLHQWLKAIFLMSSSNPQVGFRQLHRVLEVSLKTAMFIAVRIQKAQESTARKQGAADERAADWRSSCHEHER